MKAKFTYLVGPTYLIEIGSFRFLSDPGFDPEGTEKSEATSDANQYSLD